MRFCGCFLFLKCVSKARCTYRTISTTIWKWCQKVIFENCSMFNLLFLIFCRLQAVTYDGKLFTFPSHIWNQKVFFRMVQCLTCFYFLIFLQISNCSIFDGKPVTFPSHTCIWKHLLDDWVEVMPHIATWLIDWYKCHLT